MAILDYILDGLEAALELERELGVRTVEIDRSLLVSGEAVSSPRASGEAVSSPLQARGGSLSSPLQGRGDPSIRSGADTASPLPAASPRPVPPVANRTLEQPSNQAVSSLVFLHDRPLSPKGVEMMAKIVTALGLTAEKAPIVVEPPMPKAKVVVVLGGRALKRYFPELKGEPGMWIKLPEGREILITYSPEYILRFATVTPAVEKIKKDMWRSLKAVKQRVSA